VKQLPNLNIMVALLGVLLVVVAHPEAAEALVEVLLIAVPLLRLSKC
jgi:hypothetical protein